MIKADKVQIINDLIIHYTNGNKADFARKLGISPQGLSSWIARSTFDIDLLYANCEDISAEFLLTGKGSILKTHKDDINHKEIVVYKENPDREELIEVQRNHIRLLEENNKMLRDKLNELNKGLMYARSGSPINVTDNTHQRAQEIKSSVTQIEKKTKKRVPTQPK